MPTLRRFILWVLFVCVPLQGHAAAAMAFCGPGSVARNATAVMGLVAVGARAVDAAADHADHAGHAEAEAPAVPAGSHGPALAVVAVPPSMADHPAQGDGAPPCHAGIPHAGTHAGVDDGAQAGVPADTPHACGTCAACHAAALTGLPDVAVLHELPPADLAEPAFVAATRVPRRLDRPPRA